MSRVLYAFLACAAIPMAACFGPALDGFACGPDRGCPKGYECSATNACVLPGTDPGSEPDAGMPVVPPPDANTGPAPSASIVFPLPVGMTEADSISVRGTAAPGAAAPGMSAAPVKAVRVNGVEATSANGFAEWTAEVPLTPGSNVLSVETEDELGNVAASAASVSVLRVSPLIFKPTGIAVTPTGTQAVVYDRVSDALLAVDLATGERSVITDPDRGGGHEILRLEQLEVNAAGDTVFAVDEPDGTVLAIDMATGDRTLISGDGKGGGEALELPTALALDEANGQVLVGDDGGNLLLAVNIATGQRIVLSGTDSAGTARGSGPGLSAIEAIAFDAANNRVLVADSGQQALMAVNLATGNRTILSQDEDDANGPPLSVPVGVVLVAGDAFVADAGLDAIVHVDLATGDRTVVSDGQTGAGVPLSDIVALAADPGGQRLFVADDAHAVPVAVELAGGARSLLAVAGVGSGPALGDPEGIVLDAARNRLLIPDDDRDALLAVSLSTGARTLLGDDSMVSMVDPEGLALDPAGNRAVVLESSLDACIAIDLGSGARTVLSSDEFGAGPFLSDPQSVELDATGTTALVADIGRVAVVSVNLATGERQIVSDNNLADGIPFEVPQSLILDEARKRVVVADPDAGAVIAVDLESGARAAVGAGGAGPAFEAPLGIAHTATPDTALVYDDGSGLYLLLDLTTGDRTLFATADLRTNASLGTPENFTVDAARNILWIADAELGAVVALDMSTSERLIVSQ